LSKPCAVVRNGENVSSSRCLSPSTTRAPGRSYRNGPLLLSRSSRSNRLGAPGRDARLPPVVGKSRHLRHLRRSGYAIVHTSIQFCISCTSHAVKMGRKDRARSAALQESAGIPAPCACIGRFNRSQPRYAVRFGATPLTGFGHRFSVSPSGDRGGQAPPLRVMTSRPRALGQPFGHGRAGSAPLGGRDRSPSFSPGCA
jgi:hypothetical protein